MSIFVMIFSLFFVLNALGNVPIFVGMLNQFDAKKQRQIIVRELLIALAILLAFNFFGDKLLKMVGVSQPILAVAGGLLLFIIAIGLIFQKSSSNELEPQMSEPMIVPLAIPLVAGPGAIATVMVYSELANVWVMSIVIFVAWALSFGILLLSSNIKNFLGKKGLLACQKLGGMLVALIAVQMICSGLTDVLQEALYLPHKTTSHRSQ